MVLIIISSFFLIRPLLQFSLFLLNESRYLKIRFKNNLITLQTNKQTNKTHFLVIYIYFSSKF